MIKKETDGIQDFLNDDDKDTDMWTPSEVDFASLCQGEAIALVNEKLKETATNIRDINTSATKERRVIVEITIKPDDDRSAGRLEVQVSTKLAPHAPLGARVFVGTQYNRGVLVEHDPRQPPLPLSAWKPTKV